MFKNYLKIALRNLSQNKVYSFINILGLSVGITCFLILVLFIADELSYDKFYENADQTYRVYVKQDIGGIGNHNAKTAGLLGPTLIQELPETENYTRIAYFGEYRFRYKDKVFNEGKIYAVDSTFFDVFTLPFIKGDPKTALINPNSLVITKTIAERYFSNENPVGKTLIVEDSNELNYTIQDEKHTSKKEAFLITGVIEDFPENSHFSCNMLSSLSGYPINKYWLDLWYSTYVILKKGTDPKEYEKKLDGIARDNIGPFAQDVLGVSFDEFIKAGNVYTYRLQPFASIYLHSQRDYGIDFNTEWGDIKNSDIIYVYIFSAVAVFILLIAVINFMNLTTARSENRSREVGIRKALGSNKSMLIWQFIGEAIIMSFFAVAVSLVFLEIVLPFFNSLVDRNLTLDLFNNVYSIPLLLVFVLSVGLLAGSYPAFYLSSFQPVKVLKSNYNRVNGKNTIRNSLIVVQFTVSVALLIGTFIIREQLGYIQNKDLGFNKELLLSIDNGNVLGEQIEVFKQELFKNPKIVSASNSSLLFRAGIPGNGYLFDKRTGTDPVASQYVETDYDFIKTFGIELKEGRFFSKDFLTDTSAVLLNESAVKIFNAKEPVGKELTRIQNAGGLKPYKIIGVIKNFNYESLHNHIRPLIVHLKFPVDGDNIITIRIASGDIPSTIEFIQGTWKEFAGNNEMYAHFLDENIDRLYKADEKTQTIVTVFSFLAVFIACLGLFGLASFVTEQRIREIGIRKVLGATVFELVTMLSKEFTKWVLLANIIAWPIAWYIMNNWLQNFAYRIDMSWWMFALVGAIALVIALLTVSWQAIRAATANPVDSLRSE